MRPPQRLNKIAASLVKIAEHIEVDGMDMKTAINTERNRIRDAEGMAPPESRALRELFADCAQFQGWNDARKRRQSPKTRPDPPEPPIDWTATKKSG